MIAALCAFTAVLSLGAALRVSTKSSLSISMVRTSTMDSREVSRLQEQKLPLWERLLAPIFSSLAPRVKPRWAGLSEKDLRQAGIDPTKFGVAEVLVTKLLGAAAGACIIFLLSLIAPGCIILLPAFTFTGFIIPSLIITRRRKARQRQLMNELPDMIGLLKAFVGTGISFEHALHLISTQLSRSQPPNLLAHELQKSLSEYGLGLAIDKALSSMASRVGLEGLSLLASALAQGKRQGAGMDQILTDQETIVRMQQKSRAVAEASRVSNRLVGVLVLVYLPEFMVLIMVPLFYGIFLKAFQ